MGLLTKEQIRALIKERNMKTTEDISSMLKDLFSDTLQEMPEAELDTTLGYEKNETGSKPGSNRRNGHSKKTVVSEYGDSEIAVPRDRDGEHEPLIVKKHQKNLTGIEEQIIALYSKGMTVRDIQDHLNCMYGVEVSPTPAGNSKNHLYHQYDRKLSSPTEFYPTLDQVIIEDCFRQAITKYGVPEAVYFDNGKQYRTKWMTRACSKLGIRLLFAKPYSPEATGKVNPTQFKMLYLADSNLTPRHFYKGMLEQLGCEAKFYRGDAERQLHREIELMRDIHGLRPVVVVDEAHLLDREMLEEVRFLLNFKMDAQIPMALIMVGQSELWERLQLQAYAAIRQRIDIQCKLPHFDRSQVGEYMKRHLAYAGADRDIFSDGAIDEIFRYSGGAVRLVNKACTHYLFYGSQNGRRIIDDHMAKLVIQGELT